MAVTRRPHAGQTIYRSALWLTLVINLTVPFAIANALIFAGILDGIAGAAAWIASPLIYLAAVVIYRHDLVDQLAARYRRRALVGAWAVVAVMLGITFGANPDWSRSIGGQGLLHTSDPVEAYWHVYVWIVGAFTMIGWVARWLDRRSALRWVR